MKKFPIFIIFLIVAAFVALLQVFPYTGVFLMMLGAPFWSGFLLQLALLSFVIEALLGRISRILLIAPIGLFIWHSAYVEQQSAAISKFESEIQQGNSQNSFQYDPDKHSLLTKDLHFINRFDVPVVYLENAYLKDFPDQTHYALVLLPEADCKAIPRSSVRELTLRYSVIRDAKGKRQSVCSLEMPTVPKHAFIRVTSDRRDESHFGFDFDVKTYSLLSGEKVVARYRTASISKLKHYPYFGFGCWLISYPASWHCDAGFHSKKYALQSEPDGRPILGEQHPFSLLLGVKMRTELGDADRREARPLAQDAKMWDRLQVQRHFDFLEHQLEKPELKAPLYFSPYLALFPDQVAKHKDLLFRSYFQNTRHVINRKRGVDTKIYAGDGNALALLPDEDLIPKLDAFFRLFKENSGLMAPNALSIRLAGLDRRQQQFHLDEFFDNEGTGYPPSRQAMIVLCRMTSLDADIVDRMETEIQREDVIRWVDYTRGLFLTLLRNGRSEFARAWLNSHEVRGKDWYFKALDAYNENSLALPNNCTP